MLDIKLFRKASDHTSESSEVMDKQPVKSNDQLKRSVVKTLSWRVIGTLDTVLISYLITGTVVMAISIGGIELISKMLLYFFHERAWNKINWGNK